MRITISGRGLKHSKEIPPKHHDMKKRNEYISYLYPRKKSYPMANTANKKSNLKKMKHFPKQTPKGTYPRPLFPPLLGLEILSYWYFRALKVCSRGLLEFSQKQERSAPRLFNFDPKSGKDPIEELTSGSYFLLKNEYFCLVQRSYS